MSDATTPNMGLTLPTPGSDVGTWGPILNANAVIDDAHDHGPGGGVQITPDGLNITSDLTFQNNRALSLYSANLQNHAGTLTGITDIGCVYQDNGDLFYNNASGVAVRITLNG